MSEVTRILSAIDKGDPHAAEQLLPLVYDELRKLAAAKLAQEKPGQTLQATALVHEAYLRLVASGEASAPRDQHWDSRGTSSPPRPCAASSGATSSERA
jgi:DNA-directed RNA polymerase specialized sigma24 family protein